jgi:hypothetical protein
MGGLAVEQLLLAADAASIAPPPVLDMAAVEDEAALARMQRLNEAFRAEVAAAAARQGGGLKLVRGKWEKNRGPPHLPCRGSGMGTPGARVSAPFRMHFPGSAAPLLTAGDATGGARAAVL